MYSGITILLIFFGGSLNDNLLCLVIIVILKFFAPITSTYYNTHDHYSCMILSLPIEKCHIKL